MCCHNSQAYTFTDITLVTKVAFSRNESIYPFWNGTRHGQSQKTSISLGFLLQSQFISNESICFLQTRKTHKINADVFLVVSPGPPENFILLKQLWWQKVNGVFPTQDTNPCENICWKISSLTDCKWEFAAPKTWVISSRPDGSFLHSRLRPLPFIPYHYASWCFLFALIVKNPIEMPDTPRKIRSKSSNVRNIPISLLTAIKINVFNPF